VIRPGKARAAGQAEEAESRRQETEDDVRLVARLVRAKAFEDELAKIEPVTSGEGTPCGVCMEPYPETRIVNCGDERHPVCVHCFRGYVLLTHGAAGMADIPCTTAAPGGCTRNYPPSAFRACLSGACAG
jgi:hypothetical protein